MTDDFRLMLLAGVAPAPPVRGRYLADHLRDVNGRMRTFWSPNVADGATVATVPAQAWWLIRELHLYVSASSVVAAQDIASTVEADNGLQGQGPADVLLGAAIGTPVTATTNAGFVVHATLNHPLFVYGGPAGNPILAQLSATGAENNTSVFLQIIQQDAHQLVEIGSPAGEG